MNIANTLSGMLRGSRVIHEDKEERFVIRLREADYTNDRSERRIIELADGSSVAEVLHRLGEGLDQVWATWIKKHTPEALQKLEQRGFIRIENRTREEQNGRDNTEEDSKSGESQKEGGSRKRSSRSNQARWRGKGGS